MSDDYDTPWKAALEHHFAEFLAFYFTNAHAGIDWSRGHTFLDKKLAQVVQDAKLGRRYVDKLVQVHRTSGAEDWVYIHIEIQGGHDQHFARRLFTYNYRLFDRYDRTVATLALLADDSPDWRPDRFGYELFGCRHYLEFPLVKLIDYAGQVESLLDDPNPFALVTAAHLLTRQTRGDNERRFAAKWRLTRLLYERDWAKQRIIDLYSVIDWMMRLPTELEERLWQDLNTLERNKRMAYVTSVERIGIKKGIEQGLEQGIEQGVEQGRRREALSLVLRQLNRRFGPLPTELREGIERLPLEEIELLGEALLDFADIDALKEWLISH